ncbi:urea transporter [Cystobacter fuscus]|uniref:urea transporter n=1 Tax=Cystobacter fuscus TaxID=43 RepID=UPI0037C124F5
MADPSETRTVARFPFDGTMPNWGKRADRHPLLAFVDSCLRGIGQILFADNPVSGLLILLGLFVTSPWLGVATLLGLVSATASALLLRLDRSRLRAGLYGYNGALVGGALATFLVPEWSPGIILYIIGAAAVSTLLMLAVSLVLVDHLHLPPLTLPFNLVTIPCLLATFATSHIQHGPLLARHMAEPINPALRESANAGTVSLASALVEALFRGIGQIVFADHVLSGVLILLGVLVWSRIAGLFALLGSMLGLLVGLTLGGDGFSEYHGLWGYNAMVSAEALAGVFIVYTWRTALYGLVCAAATTVLYAGLAVWSGAYGIPALTLPFCLSTLVFLVGAHATNLFRPVPLSHVTSPEEHLRLPQ